MPSASTRGEPKATPERTGSNDVCAADHVTPASLDDHTDSPVPVVATAHNEVVDVGWENTFVAVTDAVGVVPVNVSVANDQRRWPPAPTRCNCPPITSADDTDDSPETCAADQDAPPVDDENTCPPCETTTSFVPSDTTATGLYAVLADTITVAAPYHSPLTNRKDSAAVAVWRASVMSPVSLTATAEPDPSGVGTRSQTRPSCERHTATEASNTARHEPDGDHTG